MIESKVHDQQTNISYFIIIIIIIIVGLTCQRL